MSKGERGRERERVELVPLSARTCTSARTRKGTFKEVDIFAVGAESLVQPSSAGTNFMRGEREGAAAARARNHNAVSVGCVPRVIPPPGGNGGGGDGKMITRRARHAAPGRTLGRRKK